MQTMKQMCIFAAALALNLAPAHFARAGEETEREIFCGEICGTGTSGDSTCLRTEPGKPDKKGACTVSLSCTREFSAMFDDEMDREVSTLPAEGSLYLSLACGKDKKAHFTIGDQPAREIASTQGPGWRCFAAETASFCFEKPSYAWE